MASRPGLTVMEVLIAASLGVVIVGLSISQLMEFFRLQQLLTVRTQLRADTKMAQERISQKLRYASHILDESANDSDAIYAVIPQDTCVDGYYCAQDTVEVVSWGPEADPFNPGRYMLYEKTVTVPAYQLPGTPAQLRALFDAVPGRGRMVAPYIKYVAIVERDRLFAFKIGAEKEQPNKRPPITFEYTELVAHRYLPPEEKIVMPPLDKVMEKLGVEAGKIPTAPPPGPSEVGEPFGTAPVTPDAGASEAAPPASGGTQL